MHTLSSSLVKIIACIALALGLLTVRLTAQTDIPHAAAVKTAITEMIAEATKLGEPKLDGTALLFGPTKINGNYVLVDALKAKYKCTATFFAKKGEGFVRIATNVIKDDGSRAVGTPLDPKGPAMAAIQKNEPFYGLAEILGKKYQTGYEPVRNAAKEIIGICYVGFLLE